MDAVTMMMSSMPQSPAVQAQSAGGTQSGGPPSAGKSDFARLLGTSMQDRPATLDAQTGTVDGANPAAELMAALALLAEATESGQEAGNGTVKGEEMKALSVMQLLQGLKMQLEAEKGAGREGDVTAERVDLLAAEIRSLFGTEGQLLPETEEQLKGRLNPAVSDRESQLEQLLKQVEDATSGAQSAGVQLAELLAAVNGLLTQVPSQLPGKKVEGVDDADSATQVTVPAMATLQMTGPLEQKIEPSQQQKIEPSQQQKIEPQAQFDSAQQQEAADSLSDPAWQTVTMESAQTETPSVEPTGGQMQPKPLKSQNASLQTLPIALQGAEIQENPEAQQASHADSIEIIVKEKATIQEVATPTLMTQESAASDTTQLFRTDAVTGVTIETRQAQSVTDAPVAEESVATLSREQITAQVREKLSEHRFTQDNGQVTLRLHPAELGELKISMRMDDQRLRVEIVAENRTVKDALMENLGSLKEALARQNVEMKQFDVSTGGRQFLNQGFRDGRQQEQLFTGARQTGWLTGRANDSLQSGAPVWQARDNALLDMMM